MPRARFWLAGGAVAALGLALALAIGQDARPGAGTLVAAQTPPADSLAAALLGEARGTGPALCELATRGMSGWGGGSEVRLLAVGIRDRAAADAVRWATEHEVAASAVAPLAAGLRDPDACVRTVSATLLGRAEDPRAAAALRQALGDPAAGTRVAAAIGLGHSGGPDAVPPLIAALDDADAEVRAAAAWALGAIEDPRAIEPLVSALGGDGSPEVRATAAWALGEIE